MASELLRVREAAELLGLGNQTIRRLVREGRVPCIRIGERPLLRVPKAALLERIEQAAARGERL